MLAIINLAITNSRLSTANLLLEIKCCLFIEVAFSLPCSCQLQWHHTGLHTERFRRLGVVWTRGAGACPLDRWWRNQSGSQSGKCSLLFHSGEYHVDPPNPLQWEWENCSFEIRRYDTYPFIPTSCNNVIKLTWDHWLYVLQWVNGVKVTEHKGGHLPFEAEIGSLIRDDPTMPCRITIAVNNTLTLETLPPGAIQHMNDPTK